MPNNGKEGRLMTPEKKVRRLTVTNRSRLYDHAPGMAYSRPNRVQVVPEIRLSGKWLARAGFTGGCRLAIAVEHGRLVVTVLARPRPLPLRRRS
jgi:hypothetical protein